MNNQTIRRALAAALCLLLATAHAAAAGAPAPAFTVPVATSFTTAVPAGRQSLVQLMGSDAEGTALTYATTSTPAHGALSNLNASTGYVVYTPTAGYTGSDSFTYTVTSGGETSAAGTVTISVTNAKTRVVDFVLDASGNPRQGKVTFILTQVVTSPAGITPVGSSVSASLSPTGQFDISVYPSRSLSPAAYYQVHFADASNLKTELIGVYDIPAATAAVGLSAYKVTDTNLATRYTFPSLAGIEALKNAAANAALTQLMSVSRTTGKLQKWDGTNLSDSLISESGTTVTVNGSLNVTGAITGPVVTTLDNLSDVAAPTPTPGDLLIKGAGPWESRPLTAADVPNLDASKITSGQIPNARTTATSGNTPNTIVMRDDSGNFNANVITAGTLVGNGSGITGVIAAGTGGGTSSTGALNQIANSDGASSDGVIAFMNGSPAVTRAQINDDGSFDINGPLGMPQSTYAGLPATCTPRQLVTVTDGPRGLWRCKADGSGWYSVLGKTIPWDFGAKGDGATDDWADLQEWHDAARDYNLVAYLPKSVWLTNSTIAWDVRVPVEGVTTAYLTALAAGNGSIIRAGAAVPILQSLNSPAVGQTGVLRNIALDCNSVGTVGLDVQGLVQFKFERLVVRGCTQVGAKFTGSLIGTVEDSAFLANNIGVQITNNPQPANLMSFVRSGFEDNTSWAIDFQQGAYLECERCDTERNGTTGVAESGVLRMQSWQPNGDGIGLKWSGHSENNKGGYLFKIGQPQITHGRIHIHDFEDVVGTQSYGLYLQNGTSSALTLAHVENSVLKGSATADLFTAGANTSLRVTASTYDLKTLAAGSGWSTAGAFGDGTTLKTIYFFDTSAQNTKHSIQTFAAGGGASWHFYTNAESINGTTAIPFDTARPVWRMLFSALSDNYSLGRCAAGVNPCTPTSLLALDNAGNATLAGSLKVGDSGTRPTCDSTARGTFWIDQGGAGVADTVAVCAKDAAGSYAWRTIY